MTKYRIVRDAFNGYEVQEKRGWWDWKQSSIGTSNHNTHSTIEGAKKYIEMLKTTIVYEE